MLLTTRFAPLLAALALFVSAQLDGPEVTLDYGTFKGISDVSTGSDSFLGMPFAIAGRLQNPRVIGAGDKLEGVQDATEYGPACPQQELVASPLNDNNAEIGALLSGLELLVGPNITKQAEDCLSINVQVPHGVEDTSKLPVLMWIHGGGFELGSSASLASEQSALPGIFYQGANLVARSVEMKQPIVFVSANYRLNAFGGLSSQEITDAGVSNLMLKDQRVAMRWIQKYISKFGGDPEKVTIWGESAGSMSVAIHLLLNNGDNDGLFRGAIMMSGGPGKFDDYHRGQQYFDLVMKSIGCDTAKDKIACTRQVPYDSLYMAVQEQSNFFSYYSTLVPWYPRPDGKYLKASPNDLLKTGKIVDVPFIIGDMVDEGTIFSLVNQMNITTNDDFEEYLSTIFFPNAPKSAIKKLAAMYPQNPAAGSPFGTGQRNAIGPQYKRLAALTGDFTFVSGRRDLLDAVSSKRKTWSYQIVDSLPLLSQVPPLNALGVTDFPVVGSFHVSDVSLYAFGTIPPTVSQNSRNIMSTFISFVNNLDPNKHGLKDLPAWPEYTTKSKRQFQYREEGPRIIGDSYRAAPIAYMNSRSDYFSF